MEKKSKFIKSSVILIRSILRIVCFFFFLHWISWFTSYANCVNYKEAIESEEITHHNQKTQEYKKFSGWFNFFNEEKKDVTVAEIEDDILGQIENKKKDVLDHKLTREWKDKQLPKLEELDNEIKQLKEKKPDSESKKKNLQKKESEYLEKLKLAKEKTVKNVKQQLNNNQLSITELDDKRSLGKRLIFDPLEFFVISPLDKFTQVIKISNYQWISIIFKLLLVKLMAMIVYLDTSKIWKKMEKTNDSCLSMEEKEKIHQEVLSGVKNLIFNGSMIFLFNAFIPLHPTFTDKTSYWYLQSFSMWWIFPIIFSLLVSNISSEFLYLKRPINVQEIKNYIRKYWMINIIFGTFIFFFGDRTWGRYNISLWGLLLDFLLNVIGIIVINVSKKQKFIVAKGKIVR